MEELGIEFKDLMTVALIVGILLIAYSSYMAGYKISYEKSEEINRQYISAYCTCYIPEKLETGIKINKKMIDSFLSNRSTLP